MFEESDAETATEVSGEVIHLDAELEEDIGAEIEDLVLFRRLGFNEDAQEVIAEALLRHVRHFTVFAEVSAYWIYRHDDNMLDKVCSSLQQSKSTWNSQEIAYFQHVVNRRAVPLLDTAPLGNHVFSDPVDVCVKGAYESSRLADDG